MLKALELVGFKSFADRTRFEFPAGISAVVGPNGSGKSNVVDAIKWVLGEQSAKSLRGREMADVIFNGSAGRHPLQMAESTLVFDNSKRLLALDAAEVHVTRRVYRSGEGEYLINRQPCRLRDIRDLLFGTGMGTEAYSVIEQGKVDVLLQSSPRERRLIFEEAAGISRFKAKKVESQRRLERVEQNLLRLADIVEEVENQLKSLRRQASKAERYRQLTERLQSLRTQIGLSDWRKLGARLTDLEAQLAALQLRRSAAAAELQRLDAAQVGLEATLAEVLENQRASAGRSAENREQIAACESAIEHERRRMAEAEADLARYRRQAASLSVRAGDLVQQLQQTAAAMQAATEEHRTVLQRLANEERALTQLTVELDAGRAEHQRRRTAQMEAVRQAGLLGNQISALQSQTAAAQERCRRIEQRSAAVAAARDNVVEQLQSLRQDQQQRLAELEAVQRQSTSAEAKLTEMRQAQAKLAAELAECRERLSATRERASVLTELEQRFEGLGAGVKEVLIRAKAASEGPFAQLCGLVADVLQADVEHADAVDALLGDAAQCVLVDGAEFAEFLAETRPVFHGRVRFLPLESTPADMATAVDLMGQPGVVASADRVVDCAPRFAPVRDRLLSRSWIVESLAAALALRPQLPPGGRLATPSGELVEADGAVTVGSRISGLGLISRRSQLRALQGQIEEHEERQRQLDGWQSQLAAEADEQRREVELLHTARQQVSAAATELRSQILAQEGHQRQLDEDAGRLIDEFAEAQGQHAAAAASLLSQQTELRTTEASLVALDGHLADATRQLDQVEQQRTRRQREATERKIDLAKSDQRLENLRNQQTQYQRDQEDRQRTLTESRQYLLDCEEKLRQALFRILDSEAAVAELYLAKQTLADAALGLAADRERLRAEKNRLADETARSRTAARAWDEEAHAHELSASEIRMQREALAARLRDDYSVELAELEHEPTPEDLRQREEVEHEIAELRRKISHLGSVNLEALTEVVDLEQRFAHLSGQHADLTAAKRSLEQIIDKINADSRKLFTETFETVRAHFQELFRKLFGGGQADVLLEEGGDILDSGVEIVARPPGKEPRSISLLSGGEKTLTCVALLLSVFRSRPSPFCILDEVDAALDEANIDRFVGVLHEFLAWTQFVIVTHSKRTMSCASTMYGVTMQESGVSKRVSVRFEDVHDNGEIRVAVSDKSNGASPQDKDDSQAA